MVKQEILWCGIIILFITLMYLGSDMESYEKKKKKDIIGERKDTTDQISLTRSFPNIVPVRKHVKIWIVKASLAPLIAPLLIMPPLPEGETLPKFLMYKMKYMSPVLNQGDCGSCFLFSVCNMLSFRAMIASGGLFVDNLSVQQLIECFDRNSCNTGGSPEEVTFWLAKNSVKLSTESKIPYIQKSGGEVIRACPKNLKSKYQIGVLPDSVVSIVTFIPEFKYDEKILQQNIANMKLELYNGGSCYCAITVYDDLYSYSGLKPYKPSEKSSPIGGHAINIVGYCEKGEDTRRDFKDVGYWICRNSWGADFPLNSKLSGYFMIVMGSNVCGIESRVGSATPQIYGPELKGTPKTLNELRFTTFKDYISL
jgi:hypothetical protein